MHHWAGMKGSSGGCGGRAYSSRMGYSLSYWPGCCRTNRICRTNWSYSRYMSRMYYSCIRGRAKCRSSSSSSCRWGSYRCMSCMNCGIMANMSCSMSGSCRSYCTWRSYRCRNYSRCSTTGRCISRRYNWPRNGHGYWYRSRRCRSWHSHILNRCGGTTSGCSSS